MPTSSSTRLLKNYYLPGISCTLGIPDIYIHLSLNKTKYMNDGKPLWAVSSIMLLVMVMTGCGKVVVTARTNMEVSSTATNVVSLSVTRGDAQAVNTKRLYSFNGMPAGSFGRLPAGQLKVEITGNPNNLGETYHYLQFLSDQNAFNGGTSHAKDFTENHSGRLLYLSHPQSNGRSETSTNNNSHAGAGRLFIIQNNDRFVPWEISRDTAGNRCFTLGGNDCFDMRSFTRQIFSQLVNSVEPSVESMVSNPVVTRQELRYIPHVVHEGFQGQNQRARGFGLVYFAEINILTGKAFIHVPMKFLFLDNQNGYNFFIDPLDNGRFTPGPSVSRSIYVKGEFITGIAEGLIRDNIDTAISRLPANTLIPGVNNSELFMMVFNTASGQTAPQAFSFRTNPIYEVILVPDNRENGVKSSVLWEKLGNNDIENKEKVSLFFLE